MNIELDHIGIAVRSIDEGLNFYERILGMRVDGQETVAAERVNVAMLPCGPQQADPRIELLEASEEASTIARFIEKRGPGLHHIALRVEDLNAAVSRLREQGAHLLNEPQTGATGHTYVFVRPQTTGGVLVELIQK